MLNASNVTSEMSNEPVSLEVWRIRELHVHKFESSQSASLTRRMRGYKV